MLGRLRSKLSEIDILVINPAAIDHFSSIIENCHFGSDLNAGQANQLMLSIQQYFPRIFILPDVFLDRLDAFIGIGVDQPEGDFPGREPGMQTSHPGGIAIRNWAVRTSEEEEVDDGISGLEGIDLFPLQIQHIDRYGPILMPTTDSQSKPDSRGHQDWQRFPFQCVHWLDLSLLLYQNAAHSRATCWSRINEMRAPGIPSC